MINLSHRPNYAVQGYWQDVFYYGNTDGVFTTPYSYYLSRNQATSVRSNRGGAVCGIYPFDRYRREVSGGFGYNGSSNGPLAQAQSPRITSSRSTAVRCARNGWLMPLSVAFVQETTVFREFGPLSGSTMRLAYEVAPKIGSKTLSWQAVDLDLRSTQDRVVGLVRGPQPGLSELGPENPSFTYYGGNSDMRGYDYLEFIGQNSVYANAEDPDPADQRHGDSHRGARRGPRRGLLQHRRRLVGQRRLQIPPRRRAKSPPPSRPLHLRPDHRSRDGHLRLNGTLKRFRLVDGRASYGVGLETFAFGVPHPRRLVLAHLVQQGGWERRRRSAARPTAPRSCALRRGIGYVLGLPQRTRHREKTWAPACRRCGGTDDAAERVRRTPAQRGSGPCE